MLDGGFSPMKRITQMQQSSVKASPMEEVNAEELRDESTLGRPTALSKKDLESIDRLSHELVVQQWGKFVSKIQQSQSRNPDLALAEINFLEYAKEEVTEIVQAIAQQGAQELLEYSKQQEIRLKEQAQKLEQAARQESMMKEKALMDEALAKSLEFKKEIIRSISHEMRSPLHVIQSAVFDIEAAADIPSTEVAASLDRIRTSCTMTELVLDNLLVLGQLEDGSFKSASRPNDIEKLVVGLIDQFKGYARDASVQLRCSHSRKRCGVCGKMNEAPLDSFYVLIDESVFRQVMLNTISCAFRASPSNGRIDVILAFDVNECACLEKAPPPMMEGNIEEKVGRGMIRLIVKDYGQGISHENLEKIRRDEVQYSGKELQSKQGFSLGMNVNRGMLSKIGVAHGVYSQGEGMGSAFYYDFRLMKKPNIERHMLPRLEPLAPLDTLTSAQYHRANTLNNQRLKRSPTSGNIPLTKICMVDDSQETIKLIHCCLHHKRALMMLSES